MNIEHVIFWGRIYATTPIKQLHHKISRWKVSTCTGLNDIHPGDGQPRTRQRGLPRQHLPLPLRHLPPGRVAKQLWVRQVAPCNEMEQDDLRRRRGVPKPRDQYEHQDTYRTLAGFSYPIPPPPLSVLPSFAPHRLGRTTKISPKENHQMHHHGPISILLKQGRSSRVALISRNNLGGHAPTQFNGRCFSPKAFV